MAQTAWMVVMAFQPKHGQELHAQQRHLTYFTRYMRTNEVEDHILRHIVKADLWKLEVYESYPFPGLDSVSAFTEVLAIQRNHRPPPPPDLVGPYWVSWKKPTDYFGSSKIEKALQALLSEKTEPLQVEFHYYLAHQDELVREYEGKFIVIVGHEVIGAYDDEWEAIKATTKTHELGTFFVHKCTSGPDGHTVYC